MGGRVMYLNSGDWIENLTALEFHEGQWSLFSYREHEAELEKAAQLNEPDEEPTEDVMQDAFAGGALKFIRPVRRLPIVTKDG